MIHGLLLKKWILINRTTRLWYTKQKYAQIFDTRDELLNFYQYLKENNPELTKKLIPYRKPVKVEAYI